MTTLTEFMIVFGANNRPPMLDKQQCESWKSIMELYIQGKDHGRIILNSVENGPFLWPTVEQENGTVRPKTYEELSDKEKLQANCDVKATNIVLQGIKPLFKMVESLFTKFKEDKVRMLSDQDHKGMLQDHEEIHQAKQILPSAIIVKGKELDEEHLEFPSAIIVKVKGTWLDSILNQREEGMPYSLRKCMLVQAHAKGKELNEEHLAFLADPGVADGQVAYTITHNATF
uniref:Retrovirus-related Pol polyprotein from transposon TNT 1-94 n=1 Tax=Tanacetum cinerariifolium TaxID=118510 RepID=A0A6L2LP28_TANCI|nr:hypothetical protein [Tanacetum cinerariifolium]